MEERSTCPVLAAVLLSQCVRITAHHPCALPQHLAAVVENCFLPMAAIVQLWLYPKKKYWSFLFCSCGCETGPADAVCIARDH